MSKSKKIVFAGIFLFLTGCAYSFRQTMPATEMDLAQIKTVAVLPFTNLTQTKDANKIIVELLDQAVFGAGKYSLVANDSVVKTVSRMVQNGVIDRVQAQKIGQALKADAVIIGTVSEYWTQEERIWYPDREPSVGLNARLVDVKSGAVIGAASVSKTGGGAFKYLFSDNYGQLHQIAKRASEEIVNSLLP